MATKTLGTGGDYATFTAAIAGIATWDTLNVLTAGTYTEAAALSAISKTVEFVNLSGGQVTIQTPLGSHIGSVSGGPVTVTWTGDFNFQIRKPGFGGTEYHWLLAGTAGADNKLVFEGCTFTSDYTTGLTQVVYQQSGKSHEFHDCTMVGQYAQLVTLASTCNDSKIDGLTIADSTKFIVKGYTTGAMFASFDHRRIVGNVSDAPMYNANNQLPVSVTTSGLLTTSVMWGMNGPFYMTVGSNIAIEKSTFDGTRTFAFYCRSNSSTGTTFRDCEFCGFSGEGVNVFGTIANLIDYCGASNGCPALSNSAGSVGTHCLTSDPLFADYAGHDYHLLAGSPRIDAGTTVIATVDPDGVAIPQGTAPDIGAFEWVQAVTPVVYDSGATADATVIATYLDGTPLAGFAAYDLFPAHGDRLVTLAQIVLISLFSDRVAATDDELPPGQDNRRGWFADTTGDKIGSRLWLMESSAVTDTTLDDCRFYAAEALAHMTRDGLATSVEVDMDIVTDDANPLEARLETTITVRLDEKRGVILKFPDLWGL